MFDTQDNRYVTRGGNEQVPKEIQQRCFQLIDVKVKQAEFSQIIYKSLCSIEMINEELLRSRIGKKNHSLLIIMNVE